MRFQIIPYLYSKDGKTKVLDLRLPDKLTEVEAVSGEWTYHHKIAGDGQEESRCGVAETELRSQQVQSPGRGQIASYIGTSLPAPLPQDQSQPVPSRDSHKPVCVEGTPRTHPASHVHNTLCSIVSLGFVGLGIFDLGERKKIQICNFCKFN